MVEILGQLVEAEILGMPAMPQGLARLEGAEQHLPGIFLVIGAFVGHAQHRKLAKAGDRLGHDIEVFAGVQRQGHAVGRARSRPHMPAAIDDMARRDRAALAPCLPVHAADAAAVGGDAGHLGALGDDRAALPGALGQRQRDIGRIACPSPADARPPTTSATFPDADTSP
jgi:hypothetical protein